MKTTLRTLILLLSITTYAQNITLNEDWTIQPNQTEAVDNLYLNGYNVTLKNNSSLTVQTVFGSGNISTQSNGNGNNQPNLTIGSYTCDVTFSGNQSYSALDAPENCDSTLSIPLLELDIQSIKDGLRYTMYETTGKVYREGITSKNMFSDIDKYLILFIKVEKYKVRKYIKY